MVVKGTSCIQPPFSQVSQLLLSLIEDSEGDGNKLELDLKHNSSCLKSIGQQAKLAVTAIAEKSCCSVHFTIQT